jgi:nitrate/nitrite transporter NarK
MFFCSSFYGIYMMTSFKTVGSITGNIDDYTLSWTAAIAALSGGIARIFWAFLLDIYGFKKVYGALLTT